MMTVMTMFDDDDEESDGDDDHNNTHLHRHFHHHRRASPSSSSSLNSSPSFQPSSVVSLTRVTNSGIYRKLAVHVSTAWAPAQKYQQNHTGKMASLSEPQLHVIGEIASGEGFPHSNAFCAYRIDKVNEH